MQGIDDFAMSISDRYTLEQEIGSGSSASVYRATDRQHGRQVAVKVLRAEVGSLGAERFLREIEVVARLQHPNIVPLFASGVAGGRLFYVMPFLDGETLRTRLRRDGVIPAVEAARILSDVVDTIAFAHRHGVVHRDIKPDNVFLTGRHAVVMDFGIAKALSAAAPHLDLTGGFALGTPHYMAPEQAAGDPDVDGRADLYAVGCMGYEMLSGQPPIGGATPQDVLAGQVSLRPEPLAGVASGAPRQLTDAIMRCLEKSREARYPTADDLLKELDAFTTTGHLLPASGSPRPRWTGWLPWAAAGITLASVIVAALRSRPSPVASPAHRQVTFTGDATMAAISPDGRMLAFVSSKAAGAELMVRDFSSGSELRLATGRMIQSPTWSTTGDEILYQIWDGRRRGVQASPVIGGTPRIIADGFFKQPAPNGRRVAELFEFGDTLRIIDLAKSDTAVVVLRTGHTANTSFAWNSTSDQLVVSRDASQRGRWALVTVNALSGAYRVVVEDSVGLGGAIWAPRGDALYYLAEAGGFKSLRKLGTDKSGERAGDPRILATGIEIPNLNPGLLSVSRDGRAITYVRDQHWSNLASASTRGNPVTPALLTTGTAMHGAARLGPGDSVLAFFRSESQGASLMRRRIVGGGEETVARITEGTDLAWSASGSLAAIVRGMDRRTGVMLFRRDGTAPRFSEGAVGTFITWAPGQHIVYQGAGGGSLHWLDPATGRASAIALTKPGTVIWPRTSPDGRQIVFYWSRSDQRSLAGLWLTDGSGANQRLLTKSIAQPLRWTTDGRFVYVVVMGHRPNEGSSIGQLSIADGQIAPMTSVPTGWDVEDVSSDGRTAILNRVERRSDVWLIDNPDPSYR